VASVFASGSYAYITNVGNKFKIVDVSDPSDPDEIGAEALSGLLVSAVNVCVYGDVAAVVDQVNGLHLLNVANKSAPQWESITPIAGAYDVHLDGGYAYVASIAGGLDIVDIADRSNPEPRGSYTPTDGYSVGVLVDGDTAWLADQVNGLQEIDVSDKDNPVAASTVTGTLGAYSLAIDGGSVYVCDYSAGLQRVVGGATVFTPPADAQRLFVDDNDYLYAVDSGADEGLRILDAFNPGNIGYLGFIETPGQAYGAFVSGNYAYVADGDSGLQIIDVSDKSNPGAPVNQDTPGTAYRVFVSGNTAYVADGDAGLQIVDISSKTAPAIIGSTDTAGTAMGVFVRNGYATVADGTNGLVTVDVSDPSTPSKINAWSTGTTANALHLHVVGEYVYVAEGLGGTAIYQLTDEEPFVPTQSSGSGGGGGCFITSLGL
jgi:hypothetical protein